MLKLNYPEVEKAALEVIHSAQNRKPYFQSHNIIILMNQPLKKLLEKVETAGRLVKWVIELGEHDIEYQPRNAMKAQLLADFIVESPPRAKMMEIDQKIESPWYLHTAGSTSYQAEGGGIYLRDPNSLKIEYAIKLEFLPINSEAEYEVIILGL